MNIYSGHLESTATSVPRRRYGRRPLPLTQLRSVRVELGLTVAETAQVDSLRGRVSRGRWLRMAALGKPPTPPIPEFNLDALKILSRVAGNLATVSVAMRAGHYVDIDECRNAVINLKNALSSLPVIDGKL